MSDPNIHMSLSLQLNYKVEGEKLKHKYTMDPELPQFIQAKVNAINMSDVSRPDNSE